jgi:hypothetical protein
LNSGAGAAGGVAASFSYSGGASPPRGTINLGLQNTPNAGTVADGDIWYDGTHMYGRIAGATKQLDN